MNDRQLHVVLGTGPSGLAVADELLARGHRVNRSGRAPVPAGAALVTADVTRRTTGATPAWCSGWPRTSSAPAHTAPPSPRRTADASYSAGQEGRAEAGLRTWAMPVSKSAA